MSVFGRIEKIKLSKKFNDTCVRIGECKSREEEEQIVGAWMKDVKQDLTKGKASVSRQYESIVSLIHLTLLGYDTVFGHVHAVNLTQQQSLMCKALGYMACGVLLDEKSPILIMIINSCQRDLASGNPASMGLALTAIAHVVTADLVAPLSQFILPALGHSVAGVRQKAVMCLHSFIGKDHRAVIDSFNDLVRLLQDNDLTVVHSVILTLHKMLRHEIMVKQVVDVLPEVVLIAGQILKGQVKQEYVLQKVPAPFIIIELLQFFQECDHHSSDVANLVGEFLKWILAVGSIESNASAAVLAEAIRTAVCLGLTEWVELPAGVALFMQSADQNALVQGLSLLQLLPEGAGQFQTVILECLEHVDPTVRLRTLAVLHAMANKQNAQVIVLHMLRFFQKTRTERVRVELVDRITQIASQHAPSPLWFAKTMEQLFSVGGDDVKPEVGFAVLRLIEESGDEEVRTGIVNLYIDVAQTGRRLSDVFVAVISRVVSLYGALSSEYDLDFVALLLCDLADMYEGARGDVLQALLVVVSGLESIAAQVSELFAKYKSSRSIIVQEICCEALSIMENREVLKVAVSPVDVVGGGFDADLAFLDDYVEEAIGRGAPAYIPLEDRDEVLVVSREKGLKWDYGEAAKAGQPVVVTAEVPVEEVATGGIERGGVKTVWDEKGFVGGEGGGAYAETVLVEGGGSKTDIFGELRKKAPSAQDSKQVKLGHQLFGEPGGKSGVKGGKGGLLSRIEREVAKVEVVEVLPAKQLAKLSETDYRLLDEVVSELQSAAPTEIQEARSKGVFDSVYDDRGVRVGQVRGAGWVLLGITNTSAKLPLMKFEATVEGPAEVQKEVLTHPPKLRAVPAGETVWLLAQFRLPGQLVSLPKLEFSGVVTFNGDTKIRFPLSGFGLASFIEPEVIPKDAFGRLWTSSGAPGEYVVGAEHGLTLDQAVLLLESELHVKSCQRIGQEQILAGGLVSTGLKVLVHVKVFSDKHVSIKVTTKSAAVTQGVLHELKTAVFGVG